MSQEKFRKRIAEDTQKFIEKHSTVTVERTISQTLGIDGVNDMGVPLPNIVVKYQASNALGLGAAMYGNAITSIQSSRLGNSGKSFIRGT